jgi:hypothetical protein
VRVSNSKLRERDAARRLRVPCITEPGRLRRGCVLSIVVRVLFGFNVVKEARTPSGGGASAVSCRFPRRARSLAMGHKQGLWQQGARRFRRNGYVPAGTKRLWYSMHGNVQRKMTAFRIYLHIYSFFFGRKRSPRTSLHYFDDVWWTITNWT